MIFRWNKTPPVLKVGKQLRKTSTCGLHNSTYAGTHAHTHIHTELAIAQPHSIPHRRSYTEGSVPTRNIAQRRLGCNVLSGGNGWIMRALLSSVDLASLADSELTIEKWRNLWKVGSS